MLMIRQSRDVIATKSMVPILDEKTEANTPEAPGAPGIQDLLLPPVSPVLPVAMLDPVAPVSH